MKGDTARYFLQDAAAPWSGIYIYERVVRNPKPEVGDSISVAGSVTEYYGMTELSTSSGGYYELLKKGCPVPAAQVVPASYIRTGSSQAEAYEDVRVEVRNVRVVTSPNSYNEWSISDGGDTCWVNDLCASFAALGYTPVAGDTLYGVKGVVDYAYSVFKIEPVQLGDIVKYTNPVVVDGFPGRYSNNVSTRTVIRAVFNKPIDTTTVTAATFTVNGKRVFSYPPDSIKADPTRTIFTYYVHDTLMLRDTITVALRTGIRDSTGYSLMGIFSWVFYTSTPLIVKSSIPAEGNSGVPRGISPNLTFNNPLDPASVTPDKFSLLRQDNSLMPVTVIYDSMKNACYIHSSGDFASGETVRLGISHQIRDFNGQTLDGNGDGIAQDSTSDDLTISFRIISNAVPLDQVQMPDSLGYDSRYNGQVVTVEGVITSPSSTGSTYIQDSKGGANIYYSGASFNLGQRLVITGTVLEYNGTTEITSLSSINNWGYAAILPKPKVLLYNQFPTEQIEGILVGFDGTISSPPSYAGGGYNMNVRNGESPIALRFSQSAGFELSELTLGRKVRVTGVVSQYDSYTPYNSGYQIIPRFATAYSFNGENYGPDIYFLTDSVLPSSSAQIAAIQPNPFSPDLGEVANIEINAPITDHLTLRIYDLKGRLVKNLLNNALGGHQIVPWDGTDEMHRRANIGIHIVHLRSVAADGKTTDQTKLLVLGTKLK
jgi:DNA/RNA endonuclease YhcR with UshA esterase domain